MISQLQHKISWIYSDFADYTSSILVVGLKKEMLFLHPFSP